jgi:6-phosphogluconolactonase
MPSKSLHAPAKLSIVAALSMAVTACGTSRTTVCDAPAGSSSSATCACACPVHAGPEFLYATTSGGQILAFSIGGNNNSALTSIGSVPGPTMSLGLAAVDNQFLYASDTHNAQIDGYSINQTTGALTALAGSPFSTGTLSVPGVLAAPPGDLGSLQEGSILYAADAGAIDSFAISASGVPSALLGSPYGVSEAGFSIVVDPSGRYFFAADDDPPGGIFAFTTGAADAALTPVPGSPFTIPAQTVANSLPVGIADSGGSFVYAALSQTNQIAAFSIMSSGALTSVPGSPFSAGANPTALVAASGFLYAINSSDGTISGYSINSSNGVLTPVYGSPFAITGVSLATDYFGGQVFVAGPTGIQAFGIDGTTGALTPESGSPFPATGVTLLTVVQIPPP